MTDYIKNPRTTIFSGPTGCGKSHFVLDLIENNTASVSTTSSLSAQRYDGIRHIMLRNG